MINAEAMEVAMKEGDWFLVILHFLGGRRDVVVEGARLRLLGLFHAWDDSKIRSLRAHRTAVLEIGIGLRHQDQAAARVRLGASEGLLYPSDVGRLTLAVLFVHFGRAAE